MKNNFFNIIKEYFLFFINSFFMILFMLGFFMIIFFPIIQIVIIMYSGFLFFKVIKKKLVEYGYDKRDPLELLFIKYGLLAVYVFLIYLFCTHKIFGLPAIILLLFFNKAIKKELNKNEKEDNI